jgi:hypothetical protein
MRANHGADLSLRAVLWEAQGGKCYLCEEELDLDKAVLDHDHSCCPTNKSCPACRRGIVHRRCNSITGYLGDDPGRLRRMADMLEAASSAAARRITEKAKRQSPLFP